jgi:adenylyltransferase/sulfurtransferase
MTVPVHEAPRQGFTQPELQFYSRHIIMPEVGLRGQEKLRKARVLIVGAGGLGSPSSLYLAAAGVGTLGLVDMDVVDRSNLHRQVLYSSSDVGRPKLKAAKERLEGLNPHIQVNAHEAAFTSANALDLLKEYDILLDGTDNFPTRYLSNDAAVLSGKPNVYGSIFRFEGQASVFDAKNGPCYRCVYPQPPPPGMVPSCAEGGVLGVLPGLVGVIQATEAVKLILGIGETLRGRLLLVDALSMSFTELSVRKNPKCPVCGENPSIRELIDYEEFCGIPQAKAAELDANRFSVAPEEAARRRTAGDAVLLDVREPHEVEICAIEGAIHIPLREVPSRVSEIPLDRDVIVYCHTGVRSGQATQFLRGVGYRRVWNLEGGIAEWAERIDPGMAQY